MPTPVKMPRLGASVAEGTIGGWLKQEGDWVERDEALAEVITDKITAELPSPVEGRLVKKFAGMRLICFCSFCPQKLSRLAFPCRSIKSLGA